MSKKPLLQAINTRNWIGLIIINLKHKKGVIKIIKIVELIKNGELNTLVLFVFITTIL